MMTRIAVLTASLLVAGASLAQDQQAIRQQLFGATDAIKMQAEALNAAVLAPKSFAEGMKLYEEAGDTLAKGRDLDSVREDLTEANGYFKQAVDAATLAKTTFADTLMARDAAMKADSSKLAARDWQRAEQSLAEAAEVLEGGNLKRATDMSMDAKKRYGETEAKAINAKSKAQ